MESYYSKKIKKEGEYMKKNKKYAIIKSFLVTVLALAPVMSILSVYAENQNEEPIVGWADSTLTLAEVFVDKNLAKGVAEKLYGSEEIEVPVTLEELATIQALDVENKNIQELSGIEYLRNLTTLNLRTNQIRDISAVSNLVELKLLDLTNNAVSTIDPLSKMTNLEALFIDNNQLSNLHIVSTLPNLNPFHFSAKGQKIVLPEGVQGIPTNFVLADRDGSLPDISFTVGKGTYDSGHLHWSTYGENELQWNATGFTGTVTQSVVKQISLNIYKQGAWTNSGLLLEGVISRTGVDGSGVIPVTKTLQIVDIDSDNLIVDNIEVKNIDSYGSMDGYQVMVFNEVLESLEPGQYRLFVESVIGNDNIREPITQISTGEGQFNQPAIIDEIRENAEDLGYIIIGGTTIGVEKFGDEVILNVTKEIISSNVFTLGYWTKFGLVIEGVIGRTDVDGSGNTPIHKTLEIVPMDNENQVIKSIGATNVPWFGSMEGYQAIIPNDILESLETGAYRLFVVSVVGDDVIREPITQVSTGEGGQTNSPGIFDLFCENAEDLGYIMLQGTMISVDKYGDEVILNVTNGVVSTNDFVLGYWSSLGLVLEGVISRTGVDGSGDTPIHKTLEIVAADNENQIIESIEATNVPWFGTMEGYQVIISNEILASLETGQYRLFIVSVVGDEVIREPITQVSTGEGQTNRPGILDLFCENAEDLGYISIQDTTIGVGKLGDEVILQVTKEVISS